MHKFLGELFASLRLRLFLLVLLVCAPLVAVVVYSAWDGRRSLVEGWKQRSQNMMQLAMREEGRLIGQTKQLLLAIAESSQVRLGNRKESKKLLDELIASYPRYANLGVAGTNQEVWVSALLPATETAKEPSPEPERGAQRLVSKPAPPAPPPLKRMNRQLFEQVLKKRGFTIGDFPVGQTNTQPLIEFACPVFDPFGDLQAVVFAALDLDWVNRFESELLTQLPKGATWSEINSNGTILVRYPSPEKWFGRPLPERSLVKTIFAQPEAQGVVESEDPDGISGFHAFGTNRSRLVPGDVIAILGIPRPILFAGVDLTLIRNLLGLGLAAAVALVLGWVGSQVLVLRPVKALARSSSRLAAGDLTARTGFPHGRDELGQLTRTFDQMAQVLERHESEHERSRQKLQVLSRRLVTAQENERRQIARELHDQIGQALTVAQLNLQAALQPANGRRRVTRIKECLDVVESTLDQVHDLSLNLRPSMLDDLGLESALRWLTEKQASLADLRCKIHTDNLSNHLDPVVKTECFRVAQEALTNVIRHAKATSVTVELQNDDELLHLRVRDNGVGFDVNAVRDQAVRGSSLGVLSMEERAALAGGGLELKSAPGQGTEVHAWFPTRRPIPQAFAETDEEKNETYSHHFG